MAALDGIQNEIDPGSSLDVDIYDLSPEESQGVPTTPATLDEALDALEDDHDFLTAGGVFDEDVIENHIAYKRESECQEVALRPHPHEFALYYDI